MTHEHYDHVGVWMICARSVVLPIFLSIPMSYTAAHLRQGCLTALSIRYIREFRVSICRKWRRAGVPHQPDGSAAFTGDARQASHPGYRIGGRLGYITDMHMMPEESYEQLKGLDVLVMNALRPKPHPTHQSISEALEAAGRIGAKETISSI